SKEDDSLFQHTIKEFAQTYFLTMHQHVEIRNIELHKHFDSFSKNVRCMHSLIFDNTNIDVGIISKTLQIKHNNIQWSAYPDPEKFLNYSKKAEENLDDMNDSMFVYR
ncbi:MAG: hypothetical protein ABIM99_02000, partial [Candidatus Dojkabacteria bacterium]